MRVYLSDGKRERTKERDGSESEVRVKGKGEGHVWCMRREIEQERTRGGKNESGRVGGGRKFGTRWRR